MTVCFEPRSNTAASARFQTEFQMALSGADRVYFGAVYRADRMRPEERLDTIKMANALPMRRLLLIINHSSKRLKCVLATKRMGSSSF